MAKYKDLETKNTINDEDTLLVNGNSTVSMSKVKEYSKQTVKTINGDTITGQGNIVINPTIMDLKFTTNAETTRNTVPQNLRKKGVKIAYTDSEKVYHVEQYQVDAIDDTNWQNSDNWKGFRRTDKPSGRGRLRGRSSWG